MRSGVDSHRHWVVKIGSAVLVRDGVHIDRPTFVSIVHDIDFLLRKGHRVTIVSSGAVALGRQAANNAGRSRDLPTLQALAALGQARLIQMYDQELRQYERRAAQLLFGRGDLDRRQGYLNARMTLDAVEKLGAVAIINENDTVATEGLRFDDNDQLAALTCGVANADLLVVLSDVDGVHEVEFGPEGGRIFGSRISQINADDPHLTNVAGPSSSDHGTGGMISKVRAARTAARVGVPTIIAPGKRLGVLEAIRRGADVGTLIVPEASRLQGQKVWLDASAVPVGKLTCDDGARRAIVERGASLLPSGVLEVSGEFQEGGVVELLDTSGRVFGRGVCLYSSVDASKIAGCQSEDIVGILGFKRLDALVHRAALVLS